MARAQKSIEDTRSALRRKMRDKSAKEGSCAIWRGHLSPAGYGRISVNNQRQLAHRVAWELTNGPIPQGMTVDHICGRRSCVNPDHLRLATIRQNCQARHGLYAQNTTGVRGVRFRDDGRKKPWEAAWREGDKKRSKTFERCDDAERFVIQQRLRVYTFKSQSDVNRLTELQAAIDSSLENAS